MCINKQCTLSLKFSREFAEFVENKKNIIDNKFLDYCRKYNIKIIYPIDFLNYLKETGQNV